MKSVAATALAEEIGDRLKQARLNRDLTQTEVAELAGIARKTVLNAEKGKVQLDIMIAILMALDLTQQIDLFLPKQGPVGVVPDRIGFLPKEPVVYKFHRIFVDIPEFTGEVSLEKFALVPAIRDLNGNG